MIVPNLTAKDYQRLIPHDVLGLEVAIGDPCRMRRHPFGNLRRNVDGLPLREFLLGKETSQLWRLPPVT